MFSSKKGFSLTTMAITVIVMIVILGSLTFATVDSINVRKLNKFYDDLRQLNDAVESYYLKYNELPVSSSKGKITISKDDNKNHVELEEIGFVLKSGASKVELDSFVNPNDYAYTVSSDGKEENGDATYAYLNLSLLKNLSLNYKDDDYIINTQSHTIYNKTGIEVDGRTYNYLPLKYVNTKHNEKKAVSNIRLNPISGVTDGTNIYFSPSNQKMNLKDILLFDSETEGDGLGEPKELVFSLNSNNIYYEVNKTTGELTSKNTEISNVSNNSGEYSSILTVGVINYGETEPDVSKSFTISTSSIELCSSKDKIAVSEINLAKKQEGDIYKYQKNSTGEKDYQILKSGALYTQNNLNIKSTVEDPEIVTATYNDNYNSSDKYMIFTSGTKAGKSNVTVEVQNYGLAKDTVTVNVFGFEVVEQSTNDSQTSLNKINFTGMSEKYNKNIELKVDGPSGFDFNGDTNKLEWSIEGEDGIVKLENDDLYDTRIKLVPLKIGQVNLKCDITISGEKLEEIVVPVTVSGIERTDGKEIVDNTIKFSQDGEKTVTLKYSFGDKSITSYSFETPTMVPESDFTVVKNSDNTFTITAIGNSDVTGTLTITVNVGEEKYEDVINITLS